MSQLDFDQVEFRQSSVPHICFGEGIGGVFLVRIEDVEVFDLVDDWLTEEFGLEYRGVVSTGGDPAVHVLIFGAERKLDVLAAIERLDGDEIAQVFQINNPAVGPGD